MKSHHDGWGWMLAADFFMAGMGGALLAVNGLIDLLQGPRAVSQGSAIAAFVFIALGAGLLILELGQPFQGWRVFFNPKAVLTFGAWNMTLAIGVGFLSATFYFSDLPWADWTLVRHILSIVGIGLGLVVATYPGVLARLKSRPFWSGPGIAALFLTSSLVTGAAACELFNAIFSPDSAVAETPLRVVTAFLLAVQLVLWPVYVYVKRTGMTEREGVAANRWIRGDLAGPFWGGFLVVGTLVPLVLQGFGGTTLWAVAGGLVMAGGALMRWMVVKSGEQRTWLPGEERYRSRLPKGDEAFLKA